MNKKPEALRLSDVLEHEFFGGVGLQAAVELRRLHEVNTELVEALTTIQYATACVYSRNIAESAILKVAGEQQ
jgi:hypothetical protein